VRLIRGQIVVGVSITGGVPFSVPRIPPGGCGSARRPTLNEPFAGVISAHALICEEGSVALFNEWVEAVR
jgi:hypothetical protein